MTIITKNNEQIIRLADYGITIPLLDEAATRQNDSFDETGINFS